MKRLVTAFLAVVVLVLALGCSQPPQARATVSPVTHIPVLEYHGISTKPLKVSYAPYNVDLPAFKRQMSWLHSQGYQTITADQYVKWIYRQPVSLPAKPILITFDDGRIDSPLALPVLHHYAYNATMFAVTQFADEGSAGNKSWESWDQLVSNGWDLQFHAGAKGHSTPGNPYYCRASLANSQKDITNGLAELKAKTGVTSQTWAVPNGCWTAPLAQWAATKFKVIWLEGSMPDAATAKEHHMRYRVEIANGQYEKLPYLQSQISDPRFDLNGGF